MARRRIKEFPTKLHVVITDYPNDDDHLEVIAEPLYAPDNTRVAVYGLIGIRTLHVDRRLEWSKVNRKL